MSFVGPMKSSILALAAVLAATPALAADDGYPPGLFEHSPVVPGPNDPADSQESQPDSGNSPDANGSLADFCASIASRTFHSLAEVKRAHARCDPAPGGDAPE
jgi:hypothetical protein